MSKRDRQTEALVRDLDPGIAHAVVVLREAGIETFESCEGGSGHCYPEPTVRFFGTPEAGWRALAACLALGLPVYAIRRYWTVEDDHEPRGPNWEIVFRRKLAEADAGIAAGAPAGA